HYIVEYNATLLVEGDIDASYTQADNSVIVATDSMKNITYCASLFSPHCSSFWSPGHFALHLGTHVLSKYAHVQKVFITIEQLHWSRITVSGQDEPHRDGDDKRAV
ncbi:hypothetical protein HD554DRAFT_1980782, partial [Boletus coccyginus]